MEISARAAAPRLPGLVQGFEIHLEPGRGCPLNLFLMQDGRRVSAASSWVPRALRDLIESQRHSVLSERELAHYLSEANPTPSVHVHTARGVVELRWDAAAELSAKTSLQLAGSMLRVQRVAAERQNPDAILDDVLRVGENLAADLAGGRLLRLGDASGWYAADLLAEPVAEHKISGDKALRYEPEDAATAEYEEPSVDADSFSPVRRQAASERLEGFPNTGETFEIPLWLFNERKVSFPKAQRESYLKDLVLYAGRERVQPGEGALSFRVTISKKGADAMSLRASCVWDDKAFSLGSDLFKYFEHLQFLRSPYLKKKKRRERLSEAAFSLLRLSEAEAAERVARESEDVALEDEAAAHETGEYLRRFHKTFVARSSEQLLISGGGWHLVEPDFKRWALAFRHVHRAFGGELLLWMDAEEMTVPASAVFAGLRGLHAALKADGIDLCFDKKSVQPAKLEFRINTFQKSGIDWFQMHPSISWKGRPITEEEWRRILDQQGVLQNEEGLLVLDDDSLKALELLRDLMGFSKKNREADGVVRIPRLQILDWVSLRKYGADVELSPENEALVDRLFNFSRIEKKPAPSGFRGSLRDYQKEGYDWMAFLYEHRLGGCLADDMGLGKTVQAIAFLGGLKEGKIKSPSGARAPGRPSLVVVPPTLLFNWRQEFANFYPDLKLYEHSGPSRRADFAGADVVLTTYDLVREDIEAFEARAFHAVIFDEAQFMKNIHAQRTSAARRLKAEFTLTLTGTPLENHIGEYYSILDLSLPGLLGDYEDFRRMENENSLERLKKRARPFVLRRTKDGTLKELPSKAENEVYLRMTRRQKALYAKVVAKVKRTVDQAFKKKGAGQASLAALTAILRLRQVCVSPRLLDRRIGETSPKVEYLVEKLKELVAEDHGALVFSQFTAFLDVVEEELVKSKLDYFRMDGTTPPAKRKAMIDGFQCGAGPRIFLISLKTGGVGLNLTRASYVFHLDPWWNPAVEDQASDRVHRIGQRKHVFVTRLLMQHTIEEKMVALKSKKAALYRQVLGGAGKTTRPGQLTREDFEYLLA